MNPRAAHPHAVPPKLKWAGFPPASIFAAALLALVAVGGGLVVYSFDPSQTPFYPGCAFHRLTGLNCPGCGATRALYALLHGRWQVALHDNALFVVSLAILALRAGWLLLRHWRRLPPVSLIPTWSMIPWLAVSLIFGVVRNFSAFAFLSP